MRLNEEEWRREWDNILKLASSQPRTSGSSTPCASETEIDGHRASFNGSKTYESLEEIHVLALAHVLKRPIFVIADTVLKVTSDWNNSCARLACAHIKQASSR